MMRLQGERQQGEDASNSWETFRVQRKLTFIVTLHLAVKKSSHYVQYPLQNLGSFTPYMCPWVEVDVKQYIQQEGAASGSIVTLKQMKKSPEFP